ncbi:MAG: hypothetical protein V1754_00110 [Pseudomonadota bacterium]
MTDNNDKETGNPSWVDKDPLDEQTSSKDASPSAKSPSEKIYVDPSLTAETQPQTKNATTKQSANEKTGPISSGLRPNKPSPIRKKARFGRISILRWGLVFLLIPAILLVAADFRNRNRYRILCQNDFLSLQKGRRLFWPFGFETIKGPFSPIRISPESDCQLRVFRQQDEAEAAFLDFVLTQAQQALTSPTKSDLKQIRKQLRQASYITKKDTHRIRRKDTKQLIGDLAYAEGKAGLIRIESELRSTLSHLKEANELAGDRYQDLADWIPHLEAWLRTMSPAPDSVSSAPLVVPPAVQPPAQSTSAIPTPSVPSTSPPTDGGAVPEQDNPEHSGKKGGSGILM